MVKTHLMRFNISDMRFFSLALKTDFTKYRIVSLLPQKETSGFQSSVSCINLLQITLRIKCNKCSPKEAETNRSSHQRDLSQNQNELPQNKHFSQSQVCFGPEAQQRLKEGCQA